jgi:hypothetical protein
MSLQNFNTQVSIFQQEYANFQNGKKVSATRARAALANLSKVCFALRKDILDNRKDMNKTKVVEQVEPPNVEQDEVEPGEVQPVVKSPRKKATKKVV